MNKDMLVGMVIGAAFVYFLLPRVLPVVLGVMGKGE